MPFDGLPQKTVSLDFTHDEFLAWAGTKNPNQSYDYSDNYNCAVAQFIRETCRSQNPVVIPGHFGLDGGSPYMHRFSNSIEEAVDTIHVRRKFKSFLGIFNRGLAGPTFGKLVKRLELTQ